MSKTTLKLKTAEAGAPDFATAKARYDKALAEYEAKREAVENARAALLWENTADSDRPSLAPAIRERAKAAYPKFLPRRSKIIHEAESAADTFADAEPAYQVERELYLAAARRETARIAQELQPRHRTAVRAIATALEALSRALEAEGEVRAELAATAPESSSAYLPDCSSFLAFGSLVPWDSPASVWARHMRHLKILD